MNNNHGFSSEFTPYSLVLRFKGSSSVVEFKTFFTIGEAYNFIHANFDMIASYYFCRNLESYIAK